MDPDRDSPNQNTTEHVEHMDFWQPDTSKDNISPTTESKSNHETDFVMENPAPATTTPVRNESVDNPVLEQSNAEAIDSAPQTGIEDDLLGLEPDFFTNLDQDSFTPDLTMTTESSGDSISRMSEEAKQNLLERQQRAMDSSIPTELNFDLLPEEDQEPEEVQEYMEAIRDYEQKQAAGMLTDEDEINMLKKRKAFKNYELKERDDCVRTMAELDADWSGVDHPEFFVGNESEHPTDQFGFNAEDLGEIDDETGTYGAKEARMHERMGEFQNTGEDYFSSEPSPSDNARSKVKNTSRQSKVGRTNGVLGQAKVGKPTNSKKPTQAEIKAARHRENLFNSKNILGSSVFEDAAESSGRATQPTFSATRRKDALKELVSKIPEKQIKMAKIDRAQLEAALKHFTPNGSCTADGNGKWKVRGMISSLEHFQMLGVSFMRQREMGLDLPRGGIQADAMGLGKTVMMLANIVNGLNKRVKHQTTLIIAPASLIHQWSAEIEDHVQETAIFRTFCYPGSGELKSRPRNPEKVLLDNDIVLTTYAQVIKSYPKAFPPADCKTSEQKAAWWEEYFETNKGLLHRVKFHRIILDEAQAIKNPASQTSIACRSLQADYRWVMSGTPVQNNLEEFFSYFSFLQVPNTGSFRIFKENFCDQNQGSERLSLFLRQFMIRRVHKDELFGAKLLDIPKPVRYDYMCYQTKIERAITEVFQNRYIARINGYVKEGEVERKYDAIIAMIQNLRQLTCHSILIKAILQDVLDLEDHDKLDEVLRNDLAIESYYEIMIKELRFWLEKEAADATNATETGTTGNNAGEEPRTTNATDNSSSSNGPRDLSTGGAYGMKSNFREYLNEIRSNSKPDGVKDLPLCPECLEAPTNPYVTSCGHTYCQECLMKLRAIAQENGRIEFSCSECGSVIRGFMHEDCFKGAKSRSENARGSPSSETGEKDPTARQKLREFQKSIDKWIDPKGYMIPSAKTLAIKAQILNWLEEDPDVKIIIYAQWLDTIRLLTKICEIERWRWVEFTGKMNRDARTTAIAQFGKKDGASILLCSLKAGGVGLNLTMATRVINVDLWWNSVRFPSSAVEEQAFCRAYRKGQTKQTRYVRFIVKDSIEEKIVEMQKRKDIKIGAVMDNETKATRRPTISELMSLFGPLGKDEYGKEFILVEEPKRRPPPRVINLAEDDDYEI